MKRLTNLISAHSRVELFFEFVRQESRIRKYGRSPLKLFSWPVILGAIFWAFSHETKAADHNSCAQAFRYAQTVSASQYLKNLKRISDSKIKRLLKRKQIQEAIWLLERKGDWDAAALLRQGLEHQLETVPILRRSAVMLGTSSEVYTITLESELRGLFKATPEHWRFQLKLLGWVTNVNAEVDAYRLSRLLNISMVPVTVERVIDGMRGSLQVLIAPDRTQPSQDELMLMRAFDYLINNRDRHGGNVLSFQSAPVAIDHGLAFQAVKSQRGQSPPLDIDLLQFNESARSFYEALADPQFEVKIHDLLIGRHPLEVEEEILQRRLILLRKLGEYLDRKSDQ